MNFHYKPERQRIIQFWTRKEERELIARREAGESYAFIARQLNRSHASVKDRVLKLRHGRSPARWEAVKQPQYDFIHKAVLPEWYALGWTVRSFAGDEVTVEWAHLATPRRP